VTPFTVPSDSGAQISGWHLQPLSSHGVVVLVHGIHESRRAMLERARRLFERGYATVLIDLQAHGESTGDTITLGYRERHDVRVAVAYARKEHPGAPVGLIGVSLGGAAALLSGTLHVDALVVESVYPEIGRAIHNRVAARLGSIAGVPTWLLLLQLKPRLGIAPSDLRPIDQIADAGCPILVISGSEDRHTPASEAEELYAAAREPKEFWLVEGAGHEDLHAFSRVDYETRVLGFLDRHLRNPDIPPSPENRD